MKIKALQSFVHKDFGPLDQGAVREVDESTGEDLVRARLAEQIDLVEEPSRRADEGPSETAERRTRRRGG